MARPCTICSHIRRAEIDRSLALQVCNVAEAARVYGLKVDAVHRHRKRHLPDFLPSLTAEASAPTMSRLHAEYQRLYSIALDELAKAQAGSLEYVDGTAETMRTYSASAISRAIDTARRTLGDLVSLASDAAPPDQAPSGIAHGELSKAMGDALARVVARTHTQAELNQSTDIVASPLVDNIELEPGAVHLSRDVVVLRADQHPVEHRPPLTPNIPLDAAIPSHSLPGIISRPSLAKTVHSDAASTTLDPIDMQPVAYVPHPRYPGSPGASKEERTAAGYPDIALTLDDLRSADPALIEQIIVTHQKLENT
jgi:hypothetical protein